MYRIAKVFIHRYIDIRYRALIHSTVLFHQCSVLRPDLIDLLFLRYFPDPFQRVKRNKQKKKKNDF